MLSVNSKRGILIFLVLIVVIAILPRVFTSNAKPDLELSFLKEKDLSTLEYKENDRQSSFKSESRFHRPNSRFSPEEYQLSDWKKLGLSQKQAEVVLRLTKYGVKDEAALKRIYVIPEQLFDLIKDSIIYKEAELKTNFSSSSQKQSTAVSKKVEINGATIEELKGLPGIGDYIAGRIIDYREKLGGYGVTTQLMDLKKIDLELYNRIEEFVFVDPDRVQKLSINNASAEELAKHPYISWNVANSIVKMRTQKGGFKNLEEIKTSVLIDEELFSKLKPYLYL
jgi:competence protein ComEA